MLLMEGGRGGEGWGSVTFNDARRHCLSIQCRRLRPEQPLADTAIEGCSAPRRRGGKNVVINRNVIEK